VHSGFILVHLSIICIAVGGIMTHLYAVSGSVVLHVGQTTDSFDTGEPTLFIFHQDSQQFLSIPLKQTKQVKQVKQVNQVKQKMLFYNDSIDFFGESANIRIMPYLNGSKAVSLFTLNKNNEDYKHVLGSTRQEGALLVTGSKTCEVFIDTRRVPLGFKLKLDRFRLEYYPGGQMAKNYFSDITINEQEKATISMNQPFSRNGYSLYQSSYQSTSHGQYISILTLSKTPGEWLVYLGYLLFILGLLNIFYLKPWLLQRHKTIPKELS
jgi:cytochrome c biogenesis protein ResB